MKAFIGTKIVLALAMTRLAYNQYRGWELPANEDGNDAGYLVEYTDGGQPNVEGHAGYVSWSPQEQFDNAYRPTSGMNFGLALEALKLGERVTRKGWNGKGMWLQLRDADGVYLPLVLLVYPVGSAAYENGAYVPWAPSQTDMLADDWQLFS